MNYKTPYLFIILIYLMIFIIFQCKYLSNIHFKFSNCFNRLKSKIIATVIFKAPNYNNNNDLCAFGVWFHRLNTVRGYHTDVKCWE